MMRSGVRSGSKAVALSGAAAAHFRKRLFPTRCIGTGERKAYTTAKSPQSRAKKSPRRSRRFSGRGRAGVPQVRQRAPRYRRSTSRESACQRPQHAGDAAADVQQLPLRACRQPRRDRVDGRWLERKSGTRVRKVLQ